jgi:hypothetical protein
VESESNFEFSLARLLHLEYTGYIVRDIGRLGYRPHSEVKSSTPEGKSPPWRNQGGLCSSTTFCDDPNMLGRSHFAVPEEVFRGVLRPLRMTDEADELQVG